MDLAWCIVFVVTASVISVAEAQEEITCYSPGSMAASVILTFVCTVLLVLALNYWWKRYRKQKDNHLILESDPEKGKGEYAFDNPGFKDTSVLSTNENPTKSKWTHWSPFNGLSVKPEKRRTLDDSALENHQVKVVALQSHDFTGLGFNICGNMKQGIYIKDILHRGPAFESGKLTSGDRINSVTISFEHMVYEDALTILSYASPYEVIVEAKSGKLVANAQGQGAQLSHPVYRSSSCADLQYVETSSKRRLVDDYSGSMSGSNSSSLQKKSNALPKIPQKQMNPEQLRAQLEHRISSDHENKLKVKEKHQKSGTESIKLENENANNKHQKFGVRVLPPMENPQQLSPKITEQNDNNVNIEKHTSEVTRSIDEVDDMKKPQAKKREKKTDTVENNTQSFQRSNEQQGSLIKRDENGIPQEIPSFMLNAALAAKTNRKTTTNDVDDDDAKTPKKLKGKAPSPPDETLSPTIKPEPHKYNSYDSDTDVANDSNTIELAPNDITIHQAIVVDVDEEKRQSDRKTASTGDLSKMHRPLRSVNGTLERAQSLDITAELDSSVTGLSKKEEMASDEDLFGTAVLSKEPRLSLILDGLNTFQRAKLKKSREWGNLEDAILKLNEEERHTSSPAANKAEFDALVDKIDEIKREEVAASIPREIVDQYVAIAKISGQKEEKKIQNQIWPTAEYDVNELNIFPKCKDRKPKSKTTIGVDSKITKKQIPVPIAAKEKPPQTEKLNHEPISSDKIGRQRDPAESNHPTTLLPPEDKLDNTVETSQKTETKPSRQRVIPEEKHNFYNFEPISPQRTLEEPLLEPSTDDWEIITTDLISTSPPLSLTLPEETAAPNSSEYLLSKIPALSLNTTDESKTLPRHKNPQNPTQNFLLAEQISCSQDKTYDTNVSDDIKVSRHQESPRHPDTSRIVESSRNTDISTNLEGLENSKSLEGSEILDVEGSGNVEPSINVASFEVHDDPKCDDAKYLDINNVSNVTVTENPHHSLEWSVNETSEFYSTAMADSLSTVTVSTPDLIKNVTLTEAITAVKDDKSPATYVTEIQVTPKSNNVSEIAIVPNGGARNLETDFENYVKNFEEKLQRFENNIETFETDLSQFIDEEPTSIVINDDRMEKEAHKIQEIAEEQLKKLPEMRFTTASYESETRTPEKRHSFELLRSNFERTTPKKDTPTVTTKSRIPIATSSGIATKTPPTSPERRDSRNLDNEHDTAAILELMTANNNNSKIRPPSTISKNVTVTAIRSNSKIPSGLPTFVSGGRPPVPPRRGENEEQHVVHVSTNGNAHESSFKQWVFNPANVTNVTVENSNNNKEK